MQEHHQQQASVEAEDSWDKPRTFHVLKCFENECTDINVIVKGGVLAFMYKCCKRIVSDLLLSIQCKGI
jgi:hypothetical protein